MSKQALSDEQRGLVHDLTLNARRLLTRETRELLEGTYGLHEGGALEPVERLPLVESDPEVRETYEQLRRFLEDETQAGLEPQEVVEKLVKEVAFTHLNRLVAFKMMEARQLIRGTIDKGHDSNAFKYYLADPAHADDYQLYQQGDAAAAYRHFLLRQSAEVAEEVRVLFDPHNLPSRLFPRPRVLQDLLDMLNQAELQPCWLADETIGWVYQFFNEEEKAQVFERLYKQKKKIRRQDIPAATQLFTPHWIVRFLVQNTLGRLWVQMHPDTRLVNTELLDYLVPLEGEIPSEPLRHVSEITLLDPACGTMHFGLVAFDLFAAMYEEELDRAGEPGWLEIPSLTDRAAIPEAIIANNLFGIDIDLRAVQLSALALYLKAKSYNPDAHITDSNLAVADVLPLNGHRLGTFLREVKFTRPVYERVIRALWERLQDANEVGSLLRLERDIGALIEEERARYTEVPLFAGVEGEFEAEATTEDFWEYLDVQIVQALDEFARQQAAAGADMTLFTGEAVKGLRLLDVMLRRYDVVVTNPPYSGKRNLNATLADHLDDEYPDAKGDLYTAFIQRCGEFTEETGRLGMITQQSFMFLSSYEQLRANLRAEFAIEAMAHVGPRAFAEISGEKVNTTVFALRSDTQATRRENNVGSYYRLIHTSEGDGKRTAFEQSLSNGNASYHVAQHRFDVIPGSPWVYWVSENIRTLFEELPSLQSVAQPRQGLTTADNTRFIRYWWEVGRPSIGTGCRDREEAIRAAKRWYPLVKGGRSKRWFGGEVNVGNWENDGQEIKSYIVERYPYLNGKWEWVAKNPEYYFREGAAYSAVTSGSLYFRWMPHGYICEHASNAVYSEDPKWSARTLVGVFNSDLAEFIVGLNETINVNIDDLLRMPVCKLTGTNWLESSINRCIHIRQYRDSHGEIYRTFASLPAWDGGLDDLVAERMRLSDLEQLINDEIYHLYGIGGEDRAAIEVELIGDTLTADDDEREQSTLDENEEVEPPITRSELAVKWVSYAVGVVLGRFEPAVPDALGRMVYEHGDFAVGSLPQPDEDEFSQLVGLPGRFAYVDDQGGRHVFSADVETALQELALPDGIAVLDEGQPRDLAQLVWQALVLMLGEEAAREVAEEATGGSSVDDLRDFFEKKFFTDWHFKWYRKRPVYWPLQSAKRSYGFVLFHEKITKDTLYVLQREYLDHKLNGLRLHIEDLMGRRAGLSGSQLKRVEREIDQTSQQLDEIREFADTIARIASEGYEPEPNWIDDGVILRMAPLWELIPIWKSEPKKYWERLQKGEYDWSHIAMNYWPERVREKCRMNKSYAIAHGVEHLYQGDK